MTVRPDFAHPALERDASLANLNTLRVPARARWLADLHHPDQVPALLARPEVAELPVLVLGEGSNVLLAADFPGLVLRPRCDVASVLADDGEVALVRAESGHGWDALVDWTLARGLAGLENLALIPGLVGAAPIQNIGAYGREVGEFITAVEAWDRREGRASRLAGVDCGFGYRDSLFKREPDRWIVTAVEFRLARSPALMLDYAGVREELASGTSGEPTPANVAEAIRRLRRRKLPDPALIGNAGSFFKNPIVPAALADELRAANPRAPVYPAGDGLVKLSAAWLIEACGWRGYREGDAGISAQHALVLVNHGHATGAQLLAVARRVAESVERRFGVRLEPEPRIVGGVF
ncbi:MAG: UDP-N-acetylmuramate dehydrogenase [Steroidobacteraceae bacterium]